MINKRKAMIEGALLAIFLIIGFMLPFIYRLIQTEIARNELEIKVLNFEITQFESDSIIYEEYENE